MGLRSIGLVSSNDSPTLGVARSNDRVRRRDPAAYGGEPFGSSTSWGGTLDLASLAGGVGLFLAMSAPLELRLHLRNANAIDDAKPTPTVCGCRRQFSLDAASKVGMCGSTFGDAHGNAVRDAEGSALAGRTFVVRDPANNVVANPTTRPPDGMCAVVPAPVVHLVLEVPQAGGTQTVPAHTGPWILTANPGSVVSATFGDRKEGGALPSGREPVGPSGRTKSRQARFHRSAREALGGATKCRRAAGLRRAGLPPGRPRRYPPPVTLLRTPREFVSGASLRSIPTNWEAIRGIDDRTTIGWEGKWDHLVRTYRDAMLRYAGRILRHGLGDRFDETDAEDCVDSFLAGCVRGPVLSSADPRIAPFRAFLQDRLKKHALKYARAARAMKRRPAGGRRLVSVDLLASVGQEPSAPGAEGEFDREWVESLYQDALTRLRANPRRKRYAAIIEAIRAETELPDVTASDRHRARTAFAEAFRVAVKDTLPHEAFEAEEWRAIERYLP